MPDHQGNKVACCPRTARPARPVRHRAAAFCLALTMLVPGGPGAWAEIRLPPDPRIARLNHAGFKTRGHCTGFATRAGPVITAAHCLPEIPADTVHLLLGYESGRLDRHIRMPATAYRIVDGRDIAALCGLVDAPDGLRLSDVAPVPGMRVEVRGYGAPRAHALHKTACSVRSLPRDGLIRLDCPLPQGTSGAPVMLEGSRDVVGVVSASSAKGSLAYRLTRDLAGRLCK